MALRKRGEKAGEALVGEMREADRRAADAVVEAKSTPVEFPSANAAEEVPFHVGLDRVLESIYVKDVEGTFRRIREFIDRKGGRTKLDVDEANSLLRSAHDLYMTTKRERHRWELDNRVVFAKCYEKAVLDLQSEKAAGTRAKQVTDGDVENRFALMYPSEYVHQERRKRDLKVLEESMENLVRVMEQLARNLSLTVKQG